MGSAPVVCHLGDLGVGGSAGVTVVTAPNTPAPITNLARGSMAARESKPGNEGSSETTQLGSSDSDGDGVSDVSERAPSNPAFWAVPGEAIGLLFPSGETLLQWSAPSAPGGVTVQYDLLRSGAASSFLSPACAASNVAATSASDPTHPGPAFFYLVRSKNVCGANLGIGSGGTPRAAGSCP